MMENKIEGKTQRKWGSGEAQNTEHSQDVYVEQRGIGMRGKEENRRRIGLGKRKRRKS
jgi:hypothetical protein